MKIYLLMVALLFASVLYGQKKGKERIDSLILELPRVREDSNKVKMLYIVSGYFKDSDPEKGINYGEQSLKLAEQLGWDKGVARAQNSIGVNYYSISDYPNALAHWMKALSINEATRDSSRLGLNLINLANLYSDEGNNLKALEFYERALQIQGRLRDSSGMAFTLGNMGTAYDLLKKPEQSLECLFKALALDERLEMKDEQAMSLLNIGGTYAGMGDCSKALDYFSKCLAIAEEIKSSRVIASCECQMGAALLVIYNDTTGKYNAAPGKGLIPGSKAAVLQKAIDNLVKGISLTKELGDLKTLQEASRALSEGYAAQGNYKAAMESYKEYADAKDTVFNQDNKNKIAGLEHQRDLDLKDREIKINVLALEKKRNQQVFFMIGLGLLGVVSGTVIRTNRKQKVANKSLTEEKTKSDQLLIQKDVLMKEIHHRVKNNLQVISALLELQLENVSDVHAIGAMTESTTRVRSISLIHQQLYQDEHLTVIEISKFARDLFQQVSIVFKKEGSTITINNELPEMLLDIDTAVPLGLILNELMTNSYKYAFGRSEVGYVAVSMESAGGMHSLMYADSGPGLPEGFDMDNLLSLGMRLIRNLSKQLGGNFHYDYGKKVFRVTFKSLAERKKIA